MQTDVSSAAGASPAIRWTTRGCEAIAILSWLLLVLRYQYRVEWLQPYDASLDALFLAAIAGIGLSRRAARRGATAAIGLGVRVAFMLVVTALALVGAEYLTRVQYRHARTSRNAGDYIARRAAETPPRVNSLGFREREIPPKTPGRYRIAIVGDSFTWGNGLEEHERTSNLLEQFLGPHYEVLNFGRPGNNMPEHLDVLKQALAVAPDFVLLQLYINDFETPEMERPRAYPLLPESLDRELQESSLFYDLMRDQWGRVQEALGISEGYVHYMDRNLRDRNAPNARQAYGNLREFFVRARAAGVPAGAYLFPATDALGPNGASYPFGYLHDGVKAVCAEEKVPCLDLFPTFSTFSDPRVLWVSPFDAHPNAMAAKRATYSIIEAFGAVWRR
jgi:hypothetical protein